MDRARSADLQRSCKMRGPPETGQRGRYRWPAICVAYRGSGVDASAHSSPGMYAATGPERRCRSGASSSSPTRGVCRLARWAHAFSQNHASDRQSGQEGRYRGWPLRSTCRHTAWSTIGPRHSQQTGVEADSTSMRLPAGRSRCATALLPAITPAGPSKPRAPIRTRSDPRH
jgi:hypothetical protein